MSDLSGTSKLVRWFDLNPLESIIIGF